MHFLFLYLEEDFYIVYLEPENRGIGIVILNLTKHSFTTVKPLITNTLEEFIKCRLDNCSMSFILYYVNISICENK